MMPRKLLASIVLVLFLSTYAYAATRKITAVTITNTSGSALVAAASGARSFLYIGNESATATIACNFGGTAVINTAGNYTILPNSNRQWGPLPSNSVSLNGSQVNCISSATSSSPATIEVVQ